MTSAHRKESKAFLLYLLITFLAGLALTASPWDRILAFVPHSRVLSAVIELLIKCGEALMIAPILAIIVENTAAKELLARFAEDISEHIMGRILPPELREYLRRMLNHTFIRTCWTVEYVIQETQDENCVRVITLYRAETENRLDSAEDCNVTYSIESSWFPKVGTSQINSVTIIREDGGTELSDAARRDTISESDSMTVDFRHKFQVPPRGKFEMVVESVEYLPDRFDALFYTLIPVLKTKVRVRYPKKVFGLEMNFSSTDIPPRRLQMSDGEEWSIDSPMLPGHSISARWYRLEPTSSSVPDASAATAG